MFVYHHETPSQICGEGVTRKILSYSENQMVVEVCLRENSVGLEHNHFHEQITYVVKGSIEFFVENESAVLSTGDSVYIPSHANHHLRALEDSVVLDIFSPMREDFLPTKE